MPLVSGRNLAGNADVIAMVRKEASGSIRLGLDLNGGVEFILELIPDKELLARFAEGGTAADREKMEKQIVTEFNRYREQAIETLAQAARIAEYLRVGHHAVRSAFGVVEGADHFARREG